jgi:exopolysaccharide biosynthesis polyprenyl glycosylphosphotransferase
MFRRFSTNFSLFSMALDAVLVILNLTIADQIRPSLSSWPHVAPILSVVGIPLMLYPLFALSWVAIFLLFSVYDGRRNLRVADELASLTLGSAVAAVFLAGTLYITYRDISRLLFLVFVILTFLSMLLWRSITRLIFRLGVGRLEHQRRVLIVGAGPVGRRLQEQIVNNPHLGLLIVGFLDDDPGKRLVYPDIIGTPVDVRSKVDKYHVDDVVIALPHRAYEKVNRLVAELHNMPVKVWVIPDYFHLALHKAVVEEFAGLTMLDLRAPALNEYQRMVKRAFDLIFGSIFLVIAFPLMTMISIAIKLDSPGPAVFRQRRVGENGHLFWMYKFRSMVKDADNRLDEVVRYDEEGNLIHKSADDPRVTRVGNFLRRTSLDESPQLYNVIRGEMSLVGPRPELPFLVEKYEPWQCKRFAVPQGMTGWWQVNGRSDKPMHLHTEDDLYYVQHYSLLLDIEILLKTVWVAMRGKGAY